MIELSDNFTIGKLATDVIYTYMREDTDQLIGKPDVFGARVRPLFDGVDSRGGRLIREIMGKTPTPAEQACNIALMLIGVSLTIETLEAKTDAADATEG